MEAREAFKEQLSMSIPLTDEMVSKINYKKSFFGDPIKKGDLLLYAFMIKEIPKNGIPLVDIVHICEHDLDKIEIDEDRKWQEGSVPLIKVKK